MKIISLLLCLLVVFSNSKAYGFVGSTEVVSNFVSNIVSLHSCYSALLALCFISKESISFRIFLLPFESLFLGVSLWGMGKYINYSYLNIVFGLVAWRCFLADTLLSYMLPSKDEYSFWWSILYYMGARADAQLLRKACNDNNTELALRCLRYGADPKKAYYIRPLSGYDVYYGRRHYTNALHLACDNGDLTLVEALLDAGADINNIDYEKRRPFDFAHKNDVIQLLLNRGALSAYLKPEKTRRSWRGPCENSDAHSLCDVLSKLKKDMVSVEQMKMVVNCFCNKNITYEIKGAGICNKNNCCKDADYQKEYKWVTRLYDSLYRCVSDDKDRNSLLLQLFENEDFDRLTFEAVIAHDDCQFIQNEIKIEHVKKKPWINSSLLLSVQKAACNFHSKNVIAYFFENRDEWGLEQTAILHTAALSSTPCLQHLLSCSSDPLQKLKKTNHNNQTVFYTGVTHNIINNLDDFTCLKEDQDKINFLQQELYNGVYVCECSRIEQFITFCIVHGANVTSAKDDDGFNAVEKARNRLMASASALQEDTQVSQDICKAFKSVLSVEDQKKFFPHAKV